MKYFIKTTLKTLLGYVTKLFAAKNRGIAILSGLISFFPAIIISAQSKTGVIDSEIIITSKFDLAIQVLFGDVNLKYVFLPVLFELSAFFIFSSLTVINLFSGIQAAKIKCMRKKGTIDVKTHEWFNRSKLWDTFWKYASTLFVTSMIIVLCICCEIGNYSWGYAISLWFLFMLWLLACGFEFVSIGENIETKTGKKPRIFSTYEVLIEKLGNKAVSKIESVDLLKKK